MVSVRALVALAVFGLMAEGAAAPPAEARAVSIRIQWGGGTPQSWAGDIEVVGMPATRVPFTWRTLSVEADAAAMVTEVGGALVVRQPRAVANDGVELTVADWREARVIVRLAAPNMPQPAATIDIPIADLLAAPAQQVLDGLGNRLTVKPAPGDALRVTAATTPDGDFSTAALGFVRRPGDLLRLRVEPLLATALQGDSAVELRMRLRPARRSTDIATQSIVLVPLAAVGPAPPEGQTLTAFEPVVFDVTLPNGEGVYDVELEAVMRGSLRWSRPIGARRVQFVAVADAPQNAPSGEWKTIYELDPGSPRLHERLRRLPGMPMPSVSLPSVPLPKLPHVPLPSVSAIVPRLSGLLATGHSVVATHPLGPMLRLPPAKAAGVPAWEGITLAGVEPGLPLAVEVEYPDDQDATIGLTVLEADAGGVAVESRHAGGFEVSRPRFADAAPRLATRRFVFWPTTKHPLILVSNPSTSSSATFGRVRVAVGPTRLPMMAAGERRSSLIDGEAPPRRTYAFVASPELSREFGGANRVGEGSGTPTSDWLTHVAAARHSAELLRSQAAGGALVTVYAGGAALWPTDLTRQSPRWDACGGPVASCEPAVRDVLGMLARTYAGYGLGLVPGLCFDAPLPAVEQATASGVVSPGIGCVGRDGRPRLLANGTIHYNILDPRVQAATEEIVIEVATRLRGLRAIDGVALVMPHDGWLHFPGVAWAIDDETFSRFAATLAEPPVAGQGDGRFAERARLVEGPLREQWLTWRCGEVAAFHSRLADRLASLDDRFSLHVVPTTLFTTGDLAAAFRPSLGAEGDGVDVVRIAGFDPAALAARSQDRVVFVTPNVHRAGGGLRDIAVCGAVNRSAALRRFAVAARRRGAVIVEEPLAIDVADVVPHGPFGSAALGRPCFVHASPVAGGPLAESLAAADAEIVFDMRLGTSCAVPADRLGYESLPVGSCEPVEGVPAPLAVRTCRVGNVTRAQIVNVSAAPVRAMLVLGGRPSMAVDAVSGDALPLTAGREVAIALAPWDVRAVILDGGASVESARIDYDDTVRRAVATRIEGLRAKRAVLEAPVPIEVLDNPGFELGTAAPAGSRTATIAGWEVLEPRRGAIAIVPGTFAAGQTGRGLEFSSFNGLATLRSNPFAAPKTGRISVAVWLRVAERGPQPPLRIAIEGVENDREYYRFASVGGLAGGRPLTGEWSLFVLQVDDLPAASLESMRVRFDLLGPGRVEIDDVRVFDLAFDESQRVQLTRAISVLDRECKEGRLAACIAGLGGYWPAFLESFVTDAAVAASAEQAQRAAGAPAEPTPRQAGGMFDRVKSWWQ
ncbi:MAG: hypothetical protein K8S94_09295 [Planctomycetia bacterium]|nr:hypothetical protein [Planctomycetia bacterium]